VRPGGQICAAPGKWLNFVLEEPPGVGPYNLRYNGSVYNL